MILHFNKIFYLFNFICIFSLLSIGTASAGTFESWITDFKNRARAQGISETTINNSLSGITPIQRVIELDRKQPEWKKTFTEYRQMIVSPTRIKKGREMMARHASTLNAVSQKYGVAPQYIVALWGIETNYGANTGGFRVIPALATLAWDGRRGAFFESQLIDALKIIDQGHITAGTMKGSWAGAMGQNQFMPSSFHAFAIDEDNDGKRDIWETKRDIFASSANYLAQNGWTEGLRWGRAVHLPANFNPALEGREIKKSLSEWARLGVRLKNGQALPSDNVMASIVVPDGLPGKNGIAPESFLVYNNYNVIMAWNRSTYFATSVGLLADAIAN